MNNKPFKTQSVFTDYTWALRCGILRILQSLITSTQIISKLVSTTEDEILYVKKRLSNHKALPCT